MAGDVIVTVPFPSDVWTDVVIVPLGEIVIEAVPSEETAVIVPSAAMVATADCPPGPVTVIESPLWLTDIPEKIPKLASAVISETAKPKDVAGAGAASASEAGAGAFCDAISPARWV